MRSFFFLPFLAVLALAFSASAIRAEGIVPPEQMPGPLSKIRFDQKLGDQLPLDAELTDESGAAVRLGDYFGRKPVILALAYYDCPMLCPMVLEGLAKSLGVLELDVGDQLDVVIVSIDHDETPEMARRAKMTTLHRYGREETEAGWHFLVGEESEVRRIADTIGFEYAWVPESEEWAHASGIIVVSPDGVLSQYYYGVEYPPKDLRLAVVEASRGEVGTVVDQILLYCFRYDPLLGRYTVVTMRVLRIAAALFVLALAVFLWFLRRGERPNASAPNLGAASS